MSRWMSYVSVVVVWVFCTVQSQAGYYDAYFDSVADADGWTTVSGTWSVDENAGTFDATGGAGKLAVYQGELAYDMALEDLSDYTVTSTVRISGGDAGVVARFVDPGNFYMFRYHSTNGLQLYKWVGGSATNLAEVALSAPAPHTLSFAVEGDVLTGRLYVDDVEVGSISVQDASHSSGTFGFRAWAGASSYDEIHVSSGAGPIPISPLNNDVGVSTTPVMRWAAAEDLHGHVIPGVEKYYLYLSNGSASDPNVSYVDEIIPSGDEASYDQVDLKMDGTYYWKVVQGFADSAGPGDANNLVGGPWRFDTIKSIPVIKQQPNDVFVKEGETAAMTIVVSSLSPESYQWYKVVDGGDDELLEGQTSDTLLFDPVTSEDVGSYYCIVKNTGGVAPPSETAQVILKVMSAHWTLDEADFVAGQYVDLAGRHDATTNGEGVTFVTGMDGTANGAIVVDANSWANAGVWSPSAQTGQFSVSFWLKWDGITGGHHRPIAKRDIDWSTTAWHILINQNTPTVEFESYNYGGGATGVLSTDSQRWQLVCATYDGATARMYVDGELTGTASVGLTDAPDSPLILGAGTAAGALAFNGVLDDFRIYNYTLTPEEVAETWFDVTGEEVCVNRPDAMFDHNGDCVVNIEDLASFAAHWLECGYHPASGCP